MGCFDDCLGSIMEPYGGNMPLFGKDQSDATVTIVQESSDDGMKVTRIQTPPRTESAKLIEAIDNILGFMGSTDLFGSKLKKEPEKEPCPKCGQSPCVCEEGDKDDKVQSFGKSEDKPDNGDVSSPLAKRGNGQDMRPKGMARKN